MLSSRQGALWHCSQSALSISWCDRICATSLFNAALPADSSRNMSLVSPTVLLLPSSGSLQAAGGGTILLSASLLQDESAGPTGRTMQHCSDAATRCWMNLKVMCAIYPTATYLHKTTKRPSNVCPHCSMRQPDRPTIGAGNLSHHSLQRNTTMEV